MGIPCDPEPVPAVCQTAHDQWVVCVYGRYVRDDSYLHDCSCRLQLAQMEAGDTCVALLEDWYVCVAQSDCLDIVQAEHCPDQLAAIQAECPRLSPP